MRPTRIAAVSLISFALVALMAGTAFEMPMFARKYGIDCTSCHTTIPRLTEMGYKFREAGFRMPDDIGKEDQGNKELGNLTSARFQMRYDASTTDNPKNSPSTTTVNQLTFHEVTLYPIVGAFNKNYASEGELSIAAEEPVEIENAYVRGDWLVGAKDGKTYVSGRLGIFHPFEGFGASDRPVTIARPLFQTSAAKYNQSTFFTPWGFDEMGIELGYTMDRSSVRVTVFNGLTYDDAEGIAHPATQLSGPFAKQPPRPATDNKDFQVFANQILTPNGGGISLFYYNGAIDLPDQFVAGTYFQDTYQRYAGYASYPVAKRGILLGGYEQGTDETRISTGEGPKSTSQGYFGEADVDLTRGYLLAARYDFFDPTDKVDDNEVNSVTAAINKPLNNGLQWIAEYRHTTTKQGTSGDKTADAFQLRAIWIW